MSRPNVPHAVVLARGSLAGEAAPLAVRVALALPLAGLEVRLLLAGPASLLGLAEPPDLGPWGGALERELQALIEEDVAIGVEQESLATLGLEGRPLRPGVAKLGRSEVEELCATAGTCLVL
ncbi:MAG: DsrE family protein [Candidatus Dormibacteria bacterium]